MLLDEENKSEDEIVVTDDETEKACELIEKKKIKKTKKPKAKKLVMNVAQTKYHVVKYVGKKIFKMKLSAASTDI